MKTEPRALAGTWRQWRAAVAGAVLCGVFAFTNVSGQGTYQPLTTSALWATSLMPLRLMPEAVLAYRVNWPAAESAEGWFDLGHAFRVDWFPSATSAARIASQRAAPLAGLWLSSKSATPHSTLAAILPGFGQPFEDENARHFRRNGTGIEQPGCLFLKLRLRF